MVRALAIFFGCTTAALAAIVVWFIAPQFLKANELARADQDIVFGIKVFASNKKWIGAKGTLTADWIAHKNNTFSFFCDPEACIVASIDQIGPKLLDSMDGPTVYPIKRWTEEDEVVAEDEGPCQRITITLDRRSETVLWVETPINQTALNCKSADNSIRKATLQTPPFWRKR